MLTTKQQNVITELKIQYGQEAVFVEQTEDNSTFVDIASPNGWHNMFTLLPSGDYLNDHYEFSTPLFYNIRYISFEGNRRSIIVGQSHLASTVAHIADIHATIIDITKFVTSGGTNNEQLN